MNVVLCVVLRLLVIVIDANSVHTPKVSFMRLSIRNPYGDYLADDVVNGVRRFGIRYVLPRMMISSIREKKMDSLFRTLAYDYTKHEFFFEKDVELRKMFYDGACYRLRDAVRVLESLISEKALTSFLVFN